MQLKLLFTIVLHFAFLMPNKPVSITFRNGEILKQYKTKKAYTLNTD
jgi:hypothetical protein